MVPLFSSTVRRGGRRPHPPTPSPTRRGGDRVWPSCLSRLRLLPSALFPPLRVGEGVRGVRSSPPSILLLVRQILDRDDRVRHHRRRLVQQVARRRRRLE